GDALDRSGVDTGPPADRRTVVRLLRARTVPQGTSVRAHPRRGLRRLPLPRSLHGSQGIPMRVASVGRALPAQRYDQADILRFVEGLWADRPKVVERVRRFYENVRVETRHLALPLEQYAGLDTFGKSNDAWIRSALDLGQRAIEDALARAGVGPADVDALLTVSVTGVASPALDARLMNRMPFRTDLKRMPIFGLGCVAGVA